MCSRNSTAYKHKGSKTIDISTTFLWDYEMTFGSTIGGKLRNVITHNVIWAIQKT